MTPSSGERASMSTGWSSAGLSRLRKNTGHPLGWADRRGQGAGRSVHHSRTAPVGGSRTLVPAAGRTTGPIARRLGDPVLVDEPRGPDAGLQRALDPGVIQGAVLAREQDPALGPQDVRLERGLLPRREQRERAARPSVAVPGVGGAALVDLPDAGMDAGHVVERLLEPGLLVHGTPLERILAPGVGREQHAARVVVGSAGG